MPQNFSMDDIEAVCVLSPNNPERKKQFLHLKKNLPQLKAFPAIMGNALSKKDIQSLLKKKILDRYFFVITRSRIYLSHLQILKALSNKNRIGFKKKNRIVYLSHLQIFKDFVLSKQKYCLILEDDYHPRKKSLKLI